MSTARNRGRPAVFVAQLHRAAAQRGKLDPVYQDLSDHWTAILQRLYPVWALIGPGLSDPGHIEIHSRTIYLDSDALLGTPRADRRRPARAPRGAALLRCRAPRDVPRQAHQTVGDRARRRAVRVDRTRSSGSSPIDRRLLEEPRMEAHGVREHPNGTLRGRFVRHALAAAVTDVILPAFAQELLAEAIAGMPPTRDMAGRATVYLQARTHYGIVRPGRPERSAGSVARRSSATGICTGWRSCSQGSCGSRTASSTRSTTPRASTARSSDRPTHRHPTIPTRHPSETPVPAGASAGPPRARSARRSSRRCRARARDSSSSSTSTSTCSRYSPTRRPTPGEARPVRRGAGRACRPGGCPIAASTDPRSRTRSNTPAATPTGSVRRSRTAPGRSTSEPPAAGSTAAPTPAAKRNARPAGPPPPTHGGSPATSPPRSRSPTWGW